MGSYALYDFMESLDRAKIEKDDVERVIAAWGTSGDDDEMWAQWDGGFLMSMKDGRTAYLWGWCDTTGWGCMDGAEVTYGIPKEYTATDTYRRLGWDEDPIDLNRWLRGETVID